MEWTKDQEKAIESLGGSIVVSAAAGSGKTAVLVERVLRRLTDTGKPCSPENLLIVTFTNAAAAQVREKIIIALDKIIAQNPGNTALKEKRLLLPLADICTIDSFCINLVREFCTQCGVSPDFTMIDNDQREALINSAVDTVLKRYYEKGDKLFYELNKTISNGRNDKQLVACILELFNNSLAFPFPEQKINEYAAFYDNPLPPEKSPWGKILIDRAYDCLNSCIDALTYAHNLCLNDEVLKEKLAPTLFNDINITHNASDIISGSDWADIYKALSSVEYVKMPVIRASSGADIETKDIVKEIRKRCKDRIASVSSFFAISSSDYFLQSEKCSQLVKKLCEIANEFTREFKKLKENENYLDFSDTLHLALKLLCDNDSDDNSKEIKPSAIARELKHQYHEILVDEYQDVNKAQDEIFRLISNNENNLFFVGDVKQSIYSFRQAMPEIFNNHRDSLPLYENGNYPAKIILSKNFRSRREVTDIINYIFSFSMSRYVGSVDYNEDEKLVSNDAFFEKNEPGCEYHLIESESKLEDEAKFVAQYINGELERGALIKDGDEVRKVKYGDFCVLMRSTAGSAGEFLNQFEKNMIPYSSDSAGAFLETPEIILIVNILKVINNPSRDVSLISVMLSPAFGFTPDELALYRVNDSGAEKSASFYSHVVKACETDPKAKSFISEIAGYRHMAAMLPVSETVIGVIESKSLRAVFSSLKGGENRVSNINHFIDIAVKYEKNNKSGLYSFLLYLDRIARLGKDISSDTNFSYDSDSVKIMTIHKSKGLEFPYVILVNCEKQYHDINNDMIITNDCGVCLKINENYVKKETLHYLAAKVQSKVLQRSEEMRILYVALTRAKEKLIMVSAAKNAGSVLKTVVLDINNNRKASSYSISTYNKYSDILLSSLMRHPDAEIFRNECGIKNDITEKCESSFAPFLHAGIEDSETVSQEESVYLPDEETVKALKNNICSEYRYSYLNGIPAKRIASGLADEEDKSAFFASAEPRFIKIGKLSAAQKGTAMHRFLQYADFNKAKLNIKSEIDALVENGALTLPEADSLNTFSLNKFFNSSLCNEILNSDRIFKEYPFNVLLPVNEVYPDIDDNNEKILIEGVVDCAYVEDNEIIIVDFKTDRASSMEELKTKYHRQLTFYKQSLGSVLDMKVKKAVIYSFSLDDTIEV
ncbi:MAG: UvrD-helicase domain-containing protein [Clostridiales bacterium]|nr:UvrD-helicase domain-containing protein [Clostridiales bacterium]